MGKGIAGTEGITRCMEKAVREQVFPGAVLLYGQNEKILYHKAIGKADIFSALPMTKDAIFDLASLTKPLATAFLTFLLIQEGRLCLTTRVGDVLCDLESSSKASVTVDMLLRHTSGLPAYKPFFLEICDPESAVQESQKNRNSCRDKLRALVASQPLEAVPGTRQVYSDLGYILLAWMLETVTGIGIDEAVRKKIYEPLGIECLFFIHRNEDAQSIKAKAGNRIFVSNQECPWRKRVITGEVDDENAWAAGGIEGHAGLFGDAMSVYLLCREIMSGLTNGKTILLDPYLVADVVRKYPGQDMAAGFDTPRLTGSSAGSHVSSSAIGHLGFTGTSFWIDPGARLIVVLLTNRTHPHRSNEKIRQFRPIIHDCIFSSVSNT